MTFMRFPFFRFTDVSLAFRSEDCTSEGGTDLLARFRAIGHARTTELSFAYPGPVPTQEFKARIAQLSTSAGTRLRLFSGRPAVDLAMAGHTDAQAVGHNQSLRRMFCPGQDVVRVQKTRTQLLPTALACIVCQAQDLFAPCRVARIIPVAVSRRSAWTERSAHLFRRACRQLGACLRFHVGVPTVVSVRKFSGLSASVERRNKRSASAGASDSLNSGISLRPFGVGNFATRFVGMCDTAPTVATYKSAGLPQFVHGGQHRAASTGTGNGQSRVDGVHENLLSLSISA
jgi:hypothetical protein